MAQVPQDKVVPNLFVATPMYGGMCTGNYALNLASMPETFRHNNMQMYYSMMMNESLITRARNKLAHDFLNNTKCTHLMFIDADIGFSCLDIISMVRADRDIICGIYPKKEINWHEVIKAVKGGVPAEELHNHTGSFVVNLVGGKNVQTRLDTPVEIENGGTGFMLIKREVFEALADKVPSYSNDMFTVVNPKNVGTKILEYFDTSIDPVSNRLLSEDYHFCQLARRHGFKIWAAPWANLTHMGTYSFSGQLVKVNK